jgi:smad nuclear-interacting protein 1
VNSKKRRKKEEQDGYDDRYGGRNNNNDDDDDDNNNKTNNDKEVEEKEEPEYKPNFGLSGALAKDMQTGNVYKGVQLKFREPPEARAPNTQWRFYVFKKGQDGVLETLHISKQSAYLMGRNTDIADIPLLHPSLSSQHAVLQYRAVPVRSTAAATVVANVGEMPRLTVQPYIMDLESTNGTFLNGVQIDPARYYQLKKGDVLTFGASTREYVLMTENTTST